MNFRSYYAVGYMFLTTAFFSTLIIGFARGTQQRVLANERLAFQKAVLEAFGQFSYKTDAEVNRLFQEHFEQDPENGRVWVCRKNGAVAGFALPFEGKGFWAPIKGVIGVGPDGASLLGLAFYEVNETPGLGARIVEPFFRRQFEGLRLRSQALPLELKPEGALLSEGQVHAISGATQTCVRLEAILNQELREWLDKMRKEGRLP
jgi:Na+-transporting NADH:ubiquinone oxidoreductase subunit C